MDGIRGQLPFNILDYSPLLRAALSNLDRWVTTGESAPPSRHPRLSSGSAVESYTLAGKFSKLPGVRFPPNPLQAIRLDHGPETHLGRLSILPAIQGEAYPALVSDVDDSYNDLAGIRLPHLSVPVATYSGWILRHPDIGNPNLYIAKCCAERSTKSDSKSDSDSCISAFSLLLEFDFIFYNLS